LPPGETRGARLRHDHVVRILRGRILSTLAATAMFFRRSQCLSAGDGNKVFPD